MSFSSTTMLLGEVSIHHLRDVSPKLWNAPLECEEPSFHRVEIVGEMKSSVKFSVRLPFFFYLFPFFFHLLLSVGVNFERTKELSITM